MNEGYAIPMNLALATDSYKASHAQQLPPGTTRVFSFFESRGGLHADTTFFGLQYYLKRYFEGRVVSKHNVDEAVDFWASHFGTDKVFASAARGWRHIVERHAGMLPVEICAVPEGTVVPTRNALMTIENTDPEVPWLTNHLETILSMVWYPMTVATGSRAMRKLLLASLERTGDPGLIDFKLHDFGFRGSTSIESAGLGGAAHLVNFKGTDTTAALLMLRKYYGEPMAGFSIPASEHSTITSWGREHEVDAYRNILEQFPSGLVACVSDSYDIFAACRDLWGDKLRDQVLARDGCLVVRPDSGHPPEIVPQVLTILGERFGFSVNSKGFKVLDPHVRVIQGDGIDYDMLGKVIAAMEAGQWSADNLAFGSGGGLLQKVNRDTQKCAIKCSATEINGEWHDVMKDPVTDPGKKSKAGRLALLRMRQEPLMSRPSADAPKYKTVAQSVLLGGGKTAQDQTLLEPVFRNGEVLRTQTLADIRRRALEG